MTSLRFSPRLCLVLLSAAALFACNRHEVEDGCLPACDADDEALFEECVAFGGGPDACRPGNRRCCALAAECLGDIGDQIVEATEICGAPTFDVLDCREDCSIYPDIELYWLDCTEGELGCPSGDTRCCAEQAPCLGEIGDVAVINGPPGCCFEDEDCAEDAYCDVDLQCRTADCATCGEPRSCRDDECTCLDQDGTPVVQCPDEEICGPSGRCGPADPCDGVACEVGEECVPYLSEEGEPSFECLLVCEDNDEICGPETSCDRFYCTEDPSCFVNSECLPDRFCEIFDPDLPGLCTACLLGSPDACGGGDSDCDDVIDEDCEEDICGNGILDGDEDCDGDDLGGERCSEVPGWSSGYLFCDDDCRFDTTFCSEEVCTSTEDEDEDDFPGCEDWDCFSDEAAGCCSPSPGPDDCDGMDSDCDFVIDEDCPGGPVEICANNYDDDFDGDIDCDDSDCIFPETGPCDGFDNDCDGIVDNEDPMIGTSCGVDTGVCETGTLECGSSAALECVGGVMPGVELCEGSFDEDCDGEVDEFIDADRDCRGGLFCSSGDFCGEGSCVVDATIGPCDDFNDCTTDNCDEVLGCSHVLRPADSPCGPGGLGFCSDTGSCISPD